MPQPATRGADGTAIFAAVTIATVIDDLGDEEEEMEPWNGSQGLELGAGTCVNYNTTVSVITWLMKLCAPEIRSRFLLRLMTIQ